MNGLSISCIVPVHNGEAYIAEAIGSALRQSHQLLEVVVVDDGSTDSSADIARSFGERVVLLSQENSGVSVARNNGVAISRGDLICFLDADDLMHPDRVKLQMDVFTHNPEVEFCDGLVEHFFSAEIALSQQERHRYRNFTKQLVGHHIISWMMHRDCFERVGGFTPGMAYCEDLDFYSRCRDMGCVMYNLVRVISSRRLHDNNVTSFQPAKQTIDMGRFLKAHLDRQR